MNISNVTEDINPTKQPPPSTLELVILLIIVTIFLLFGIIGNSSVICTIFFSKKLKLIQHGLIISLSLADFIFLSFGFPIIIVSLSKNDWIFSYELCVFQGLVVTTTTLISVGNLAIISVNRYMSICQIPLYKRLFTKRYVLILSFVAWLYGLLPPCLSVLFKFTVIHFESVLDTCVFKFDYNLGFNVFISMFYGLPLFLIIYCYVEIYRTVWKSRKKVGLIVNIGNNNSNNNSYNNTKKPKKEDLRLAIQLFIVFIAFIICWYPLLIVVLFIDKSMKLSSIVYDITGNLIVLNAVINPPIYFYFNSTLRKELIKIIKCKKQQTSQITEISLTRVT